MQARMGSTRAKPAASPPTMMDSVASMAPCSPPLTGVSMKVIPRVAQAAAASWANFASVVLRSAMRLPEGIVEASPPSAMTTCRTTSPVGSDRKTISPARAIAAAEAAALPPASVKAFSRPGSGS